MMLCGKHTAKIWTRGVAWQAFLRKVWVQGFVNSNTSKQPFEKPITKHNRKSRLILYTVCSKHQTLRRIFFPLLSYASILFVGRCQQCTLLCPYMSSDVEPFVFLFQFSKVSQCVLWCLVTISALISYIDMRLNTLTVFLG